MTASLLLIGTELTTGAVSDLHARYLGARLTACGIDVVSVTLFSDTADFDADLRRLANERELVIITGGLGPTTDDRVRDVVSEAAGVSLRFHPELWEAITRRYSGRRVPGTNRKQAMIPEGFTAIPNEKGTAAGFWGRMGRALVLAVPGPPRELEFMMEQDGFGIIGCVGRERPDDRLDFSCFLVSESLVEEVLQCSAPAGITWSTRAEAVRIVVSLFGGSVSVREELFGRLIHRFGRLCLHRGTVTAAEILVAAFGERGLTAAFAESCTGGLVTTMITDVPGSSAILWGGFVTYSNEAKEEILDVTGIPAHGAVSEQTVREMALCTAARSRADVVVSITGIAGPGGGSAEKPVGTVWMGLWSKGRGLVGRRFSFSGDRDRVRTRTAVAALLLAYGEGVEIDLDNDPLWDYI